ncbi:MAG: outer membrane protein assembly factor BamA, partial [Candidatus Omnitrophica bacterium]|nr:outer membrane protein assembly factor BamA [Candidatus Omnitrophota bacterium]
MIKRISLYIFLFFVFVFAFEVFAADNVLKIDIDGNIIVSDATIISKIKIRAGQIYNTNIINEDIKNLYSTGFFETVEVEKQESSEGVIALFKVKEKPILKKLKIEGNKKIHTKMIMSKVIKETLPSYVSGKVSAKGIDIKQGVFLDEYALKQTKQKIEDFYRVKGFSGISVSYDIEYIGNKNEVNVVYNIDEGGVVKVRDVAVTGNKFVSINKIKKIIKIKKSWLFNRGIFKKEVLNDDIKRVTDYYKSKGFSDVVVNIDAEYKIKGVYISVKVNEGKRYFIGLISMEGNKNISLEDITEVIKVKDGDIYSEQVIYEVASRIRGIYIDRGYIFSQVEPFSFLNADTGKINIDFRIIENEIAYIDEITIKGNTKTKDKIIRRELKVYPGDKFDGKKVRRSKEKLDNLGFFEEIRFGTDPGEEPNNVDLVIDVKESKTGYFSFGGGYSSVDEFMGFVELRQRNFDYRNFSNFTGAGQDLSLMLSMGNLTENLQLSFTNPWIFDKPLSFGFDVYKRGHDQDDNVGYGYSEEISGGAFRFERELSDYWKGGFSYKYEKVDISDIVS